MIINFTIKIWHRFTSKLAIKKKNIKIKQLKNKLEIGTSIDREDLGLLIDLIQISQSKEDLGLLIDLIRISQSNDEIYRSFIKEERRKIRTKAIEALISIGGKDVVSAIFYEIKNPNEDNKDSADAKIQMIEALVKIGDLSAIDSIASVINPYSSRKYENQYYNHNTTKVRTAAAQALCMSSNIKSIRTLIYELNFDQKENASVRKACIDSLVKIGAKNIDHIEKYLLDELSEGPWSYFRNNKIFFHDANIQAIIEIFNRLGVLKWKKALETDKNIMLALGKFRDKQFLEVLLNGLDSMQTIIREQAAIALGNYGDPVAINPLIEKLRESEISLEVGVGSIIKIGDPLELLIKMLGKKDKSKNSIGKYHEELSEFAAKRIYELEIPHTLQEFIKSLKDNALNFIQRKQITILLSKFGGKSEIKLLVEIIAKEKQKGNDISFSDYPRSLGHYAIDTLIFLINKQASRAINKFFCYCRDPGKYSALSLDAVCDYGPPEEYRQYLENIKQSLYRSVNRFIKLTIVELQKGTIGQTDEEIYKNINKILEKYVYSNETGLKTKIERGLPPAPEGYKTLQCPFDNF